MTDEIIIGGNYKYSRGDIVTVIGTAVDYETFDTLVIFTSGDHAFTLAMKKDKFLQSFEYVGKYEEATIQVTVEKEEPVFDVTNGKDSSGHIVPIVKRISE